MAFNATVSAGWTYKTGDTVTAANLNALGVPTVSVPDDKTYLINVGSVSAPGIAFFGDANTGLAQLAGVDTASIVAGGNEVVRFIGNRQTGFSDGTDSAPSITFIGDGDTGINHDTADQIDFVCDKTVVGQFNTSGLTVAGGVTATGAIAAASMTVNGATVLTSGISQAVVSYYTDFIGSTTSWGTTSITSGTGAVGTITTGHGTGDTSSRGYVSLSTPATNDRAGVSVNFSTLPSTGYARFRVQTINPLSTPSNRYRLFIGLFNDPTAVTTTTGSGAWFQYADDASAQWQTVTFNGTSRETQTTGTTVAVATDYTFEIRHTAASTWEFYINGVLAATHSTVTFSSTTGNFLAVAAVVLNTVGTGGTLYVDSIEAVTPLTRT